MFLLSNKMFWSPVFIDIIQENAWYNQESNCLVNCSSQSKTQHTLSANHMQYNEVLFCSIIWYAVQFSCFQTVQFSSVSRLCSSVQFPTLPYELSLVVTLTWASWACWQDGGVSASTTSLFQDYLYNELRNPNLDWMKTDTSNFTACMFVGKVRMSHNQDYIMAALTFQIHVQRAVTFRCTLGHSDQYDHMKSARDFEPSKKSARLRLLLRTVITKNRITFIKQVHQINHLHMSITFIKSTN